MTQTITEAGGKSYVATGIAETRLGVCSKTLRKWAKDGTIAYHVTPGGKFRFDVDGYLAAHRPQPVEPPSSSQTGA